MLRFVFWLFVQIYFHFLIIGINWISCVSLLTFDQLLMIALIIPELEWCYAV